MWLINDWFSCEVRNKAGSNSEVAAFQDFQAHVVRVSKAW